MIYSLFHFNYYLILFKYYHLFWVLLLRFVNFKFFERFNCWIFTFWNICLICFPFLTLLCINIALLDSLPLDLIQWCIQFRFREITSVPLWINRKVSFSLLLLLNYWFIYFEIMNFLKPIKERIVNYGLFQISMRTFGSLIS